MDTGTKITALAGVGLLLALVTLAVPWWTIDVGFGAGSVSVDVKPFDAGGTEATSDVSEEFVASTGVLLVGFVALAGIVSSMIGTGWWVSSRQNDEVPSPAAGWVITGGGVGLVLAAVLAAGTWPSGELGFWDSIAAGGNVALASSASLGWYGALLAGSLIGAAGLIGLHHLTPEEVEPSRVPGP